MEKKEIFRLVEIHYPEIKDHPDVFENAILICYKRAVITGNMENHVYQLLSAPVSYADPS